MKLIIDIPEWKYKSICEGVEASKRCGVVGIDPDIHKAIYNGTPLPKGHGMMKDEICIQDKYDKRILARRYGNVFDCNNCGRSWIACKDDIIESYELYVKLRCPYCHNMIDIPRNFNWF